MFGWVSYPAPFSWKWKSRGHLQAPSPAMAGQDSWIFGTHARSNAMNWEISKYLATLNAIQNSDTIQLRDKMLKQL